VAHYTRGAPGFTAQQSAEIVADGLCELTLMGVEFDGGDGLAVPLSVTLLNTDELIPRDGD
jgi:hypothetical protein